MITKHAIKAALQRDRSIMLQLLVASVSNVIVNEILLFQLGGEFLEYREKMVALTVFLTLPVLVAIFYGIFIVMAFVHSIKNRNTLAQAAMRSVPHIIYISIYICLFLTIEFIYSLSRYGCC